MRIVINRINYDKKQTVGRLTIVNDDNEVIFSCKTLELSWLNNATSISCIPEGNYKVRKRNSEKYGNHLHILDVPNRSYILIHQGNYYTQIRGCVLVGSKFIDINNDKQVDVIESKLTLNRLLSVIDVNELDLEIC